MPLVPAPLNAAAYHFLPSANGSTNNALSFGLIPVQKASDPWRRRIPALWLQVSQRWRAGDKRLTPARIIISFRE